MDAMISECKRKVACFRLKELKDVLSQLGLVKTAKKEELVNRVLALLSGEQVSDARGFPNYRLIGVAKIIDGTFRKMQRMEAGYSETAILCVSGSSSITPEEETVYQGIRCPCRSQVKTESMIQCADPQCQIWQHMPCVILPDASPMETSPAPSKFYCELCRVNRSDPFWKTLRHPLYPVKLQSTCTSSNDDTEQSVETSFQITSADLILFKNAGYDLHAWCLLLNDRILFRLQWPKDPLLSVNGSLVKTICRPSSYMLGANGRDDGVSISQYIVEGSNKISLTVTDARSFCLGVSLVKRLDIQQVINLIPSEQEGESFTDAVVRVCRCISGGNAAAIEDSDSDLEIITDNVTINLRCPVSGSRMKVAARFRGCLHLGCFDLCTFIEITKHSKKWQCPNCLKNYSLEDIIIDPYLNRILGMCRPTWPPSVNVKAKYILATH